MTLQQEAAGAALVLVRVAGVVGTAPALGNARVPGLYKVGLALVLTAILYPLLPEPPRQWDAGRLALAVLWELVVGAGLGAAASAALSAAMAAGECLDVQAGLGNATLLDPAGSTPQPLLASLFQALMVLTALHGELHLQLVRGLALSFRWLPLGGGETSLDLPRLALMAGASFFGAVAALAAPVLVGMLGVEIIGALLSRVLPGLNVLMAMAPLRVLAVMALALAALPGTLRTMEGVLDGTAALLQGG